MRVPLARTLLVLISLCLAMPSGHALPAGIVPPGMPITDPSILCAAALDLAQTAIHTPTGLLQAIATVESGRMDTQTGKNAPWPWTIDADGTGHVYPTEATAVAAARNFETQGVTSLDIGCMQINLQHHPDAFTSLAQAFDPASNAIYGARFLRQLKTKLGDWNQAAGAYHSQTPAIGLPYEQKVLDLWQGKNAPSVEAPTLIPVAAGMSAIPKPTSAPAQPTAGAIAMRHFGVGGFAFAGLHGHTVILPIAAPIGGGTPAAGMIGRGLAAYRRDPIPITGAK